MNIVVMIAQLILSLSFLVILHELGHFIPAKLFKTRVEKFYLFFDPWFSLAKKKIGETVYGIGWLPLGGYVKISGMIDESMDKEQMKQPMQPWEFRAKPAWQRLIIMLGGVTVNFILGFLIFGLILFAYGESYLPAENAKYGIAVDSMGYEIGLRDGDRIISVGDKSFDKFNPAILIKEVVLHDANTIVVERDGREVKVNVDPKYTRVLSSSVAKDWRIFWPRVPFEIGGVVDGSPAEKAGLQIDDRIVGLNDTPTPYFNDFANLLKGRKNEQIRVAYQRDSSTDTVSLVTSEDATLGVQVYGPDRYFAFDRQSYAFFEAIPAGFQKGYRFLADQVIAFGQMFRGKIKASESLGGFGTITQLFPPVWDWQSFWRVTAILSLILAVMNLLPIPALDGGHVMFLIWEVITGRKPSDKFMEIATIIGFILVIGLVLYANGLDIFRALK